MIEYGRIAWEAYSKSFATYTGDATLLPEWDDLIAPVRKAWDMAAVAIIDELTVDVDNG